VLKAPELLARAVNARIYEIAVRYGEDVDIDYLCECDCMRIVKVPPDEYTTRGAVFEGHARPPTGTRGSERSLTGFARRNYAQARLFVLPRTVHCRFPLDGCTDPGVDFLRIDTVDGEELGHDVVKPVEALRNPPSEPRALLLDVT